MIISSGCASAPVYDQIFKEDNSYNQRSFAVSQRELYLATLKTIYAKNFMIDKESEEKDFIVARRSFQEGKKTTILIVQAKIVGDEQGGSSTLFLSGLETTERSYVADRTRFLLFIVPLPGGGGKQASTTKEGERVINDKEFYKNFFNEIDKAINKSQELRFGVKAVEENKANEPKTE
jgi:hypothetical protein